MRLARFVGLASLGFASIVLSASCSLLPQQAATAPGTGSGGSPGGGRQRPPVVVSAVPIKEGKIASVLTYSGNTQPRAQVNLVPKSSGRVEKLRVDVGSVVKAGDVLAELDHGTLDAQLRQAEANVAAAEARVATVKAGGRVEDIASAQAGLKSAQARLDLVKRGATAADLQAAQGSVAAAQARFDKARADLARLKNPPTQDELTAARAAVDKAAATLQKAQADYDKVAFRPDVGALPQATTLQQATIDYQSALANFNVKMSPRAEDVTATEKSLASAEADLATAQAKLDQMKKGATDEDLVIAEATVQQASNTLLLRKSPYTESDLKSAQASLAQAQAALELARAQRADANITAPFDGVVSQKLLSEGALAGPASPLLTLVSPEVELVLNIEEARIAQLRAGQRVELTVPGFPGQIFPGKVANVSPTADPKSHTFSVKIAPDQQDGKLRAGMFAEVRVTTEEKDKAVLLPRDALTQKSGKNVVYVIAEGQAKMREITLGIAAEKELEAVSGVTPGEQVAIAGLASLNDGDTVRVMGQQDQGGARQGPPGKPSGKPEGFSKPEGASQPAGFTRPEGAVPSQEKPQPQDGGSGR